jgi:hypothetical protein
MRAISSRLSAATARPIVGIIFIWRDLHALPKRKADKSDEDDEGEKWDNPIRHGQLHSGRLSWRPLSFADVPFYSLATYVSEAIGHAGPPNLIL